MLRSPTSTEADGVHLRDEIELVLEFLVDFGIRFVAARRDVEIVQQDRLAAGAHSHRQMPAILDLAETALFDHLDRPPRHGGDAVIALLSMEGDVPVAELAECLFREQFVRNLGLLQAQHIGGVLIEQAFDDRHAQAHGVDVPGGDGKGHLAIRDSVLPARTDES
jgi:hypothetical protein